MNDRIGIIGAGTIADAYYIPSLQYLGFTDITLYDVNEQSAVVLAQKHCIKTAQLQHLIHSASILIIATPPHSHFELLKQCITQGNKTIICEKPFLYTKQEALTVVELAHQHSATVLVAHIRRVFTTIDAAKHLIPTLDLGTLKKAQLWEGGRFTYKPKSDYTTHNMYGGVLLDTGSHALDCFLYVSGLTQEPLTCTVNEAQKDKAEPAHEVFYAFLLNSIEVNLNLSRYKALANKIALYYENGIVEIPLGLKPNFAVTIDGQRKIYASEQRCLNYMTEAFRLELHKMLIQKEKALFEASDFVNLSYILETLYNA